MCRNTTGRLCVWLMGLQVRHRQAGAKLISRLGLRARTTTRRRLLGVAAARRPGLLRRAAPLAAQPLGLCSATFESPLLTTDLVLRSARLGRDDGGGPDRPDVPQVPRDRGAEGAGGIGVLPPQRP